MYICAQKALLLIRLSKVLMLRYGAFGYISSQHVRLVSKNISEAKFGHMMLEGHSSVQGLCSGVRMDSNRKKKLHCLCEYTEDEALNY